jgi:hypothetical protein
MALSEPTERILHLISVLRGAEQGARLTDRLLSGVAVDSLGGPAPGGNETLLIDPDERIVSCVPDRIELSAGGPGVVSGARCIQQYRDVADPPTFRRDRGKRQPRAEGVAGAIDAASSKAERTGPAGGQQAVEPTELRSVLGVDEPAHRLTVQLPLERAQQPFGGAIDREDAVGGGIEDQRPECSAFEDRAEAVTGAGRGFGCAFRGNPSECGCQIGRPGRFEQISIGPGMQRIEECPGRPGADGEHHRGLRRMVSQLHNVGRRGMVVSPTVDQDGGGLVPVGASQGGIQVGGGLGSIAGLGQQFA